jgi:hypothetical protein
VREVLPCPTLQILFAKKLKNGMNCFSTGFRAGDKENRNSAHWITTKIASADPNFRGNACTKALRTKKQSESERERCGRRGRKQRESSVVIVNLVTTHFPYIAEFVFTCVIF